MSKGSSVEVGRDGERLKEILNRYMPLFREDLGLGEGRNGAPFGGITILYNDNDGGRTASSLVLFQTTVRNVAASLLHPRDEEARMEARQQMEVCPYGVDFEGSLLELYPDRLSSERAVFIFERRYSRSHVRGIAARLKTLIAGGDLHEDFKVPYVTLDIDPMDVDSVFYNRIGKDTLMHIGAPTV